MKEILGDLNSAFTLAFVVSSMFGLGLGYTLQDLLRPLRRMRFLITVVLANFVIVPGVALLLTQLLPLDPDLRVGLILMGCVAGAPLTIKAATAAHGDVKLAGSLVALQVVLTVLFLPFALPWFIPGISVDTVSVAMPLIVQILLPLAAGVLVNARYVEESKATRPIMAYIANTSLTMMLVLNLGNVPQLLGLLGTGSIIGIVVLILAGFAAGFLLGGTEKTVRRTMALGTAQRNYAAAFVLAQGSFAAQHQVFLLLLTASTLSMFLVLGIANEIGKRAGDQLVAAKAAS